MIQKHQIKPLNKINLISPLGKIPERTYSLIKLQNNFYNYFRTAWIVNHFSLFNFSLRLKSFILRVYFNVVCNFNLWIKMRSSGNRYFSEWKSYAKWLMLKWIAFECSLMSSNLNDSRTRNAQTPTISSFWCTWFFFNFASFPPVSVFQHN